MIFTERTIRIVNGLCEIDNPIILYRGDFNVEIRFTIIDCPYKYTAKDASNVIETTNASYGQLVIKTPNGDPIFSDVTATNEGAVVFTITGDMIDETIELGEYDFQIRLFDSEQTSRATICPVVGGIKIEEPIAIEGGSVAVTDTNEVNVARTNYAVTTTASALDAFDSQGNYIETTWADKMLITDARLNKIEDGITGVNQKVTNINIPTVPTKTSQLTNDSDFATNASVDEKIAEASLGGSGGEVNLSAYQTKTDNTLTTTDKTVVGAINEMNEAMVIAEEQTGDITVGDIPVGGTTIYIGDTAPTNGALYWYDTSVSVPDTPPSGDGGSETPPEQPEPTTYTITNTLTNCATNNSTGSVNKNSSYTATITANDGYELGAITVTMGDTNITSTAVSGNVITISSVTGNVVITCTATATSSGGGTPSEPGGGSATTDITMTNKTSLNIKWYSDDGSTQLVETAKAYSYSSKFDTDTQVEISLVLNSTNYSNQLIGAYKNASNFSIVHHAIYWEKNTTYFEAGKTYTATYTVPAGYGLIVGGWPNPNMITSLVVKAKA